jgi:hypothetical protein
VLTAGHCTEGPATNVYVSFDFALQPDPLQPGISPAERAARAAHYITGTAHPDPGWTGKLSISKQHDQGVVVLDAAAATKWPGITPAPLPPVGFLDRNSARSSARGLIPPNSIEVIQPAVPGHTWLASRNVALTGASWPPSVRSCHEGRRGWTGKSGLELLPEGLTGPDGEPPGGGYAQSLSRW